MRRQRQTVKTGSQNMFYRSWLLVPGDNEKKLGLASSAGADIVVIDLAALVPFETKAIARSRAADWLALHHQQVTQRSFGRWVRINSLESRMWQDDLRAIMPAAPDGIVLPYAASTESVRQVAAELYELEQDNQLPPGKTRIMPIVGETPATALTISSFADNTQPRMEAIGWEPQSLARSINAARVRDSKGNLTDTFRFVRSQALLAAHSCGTMAIEAVQPNLVDQKKLAIQAKESRADGFTGMLVYHPSQIAEINSAFTPSEAELAQARNVVAASENAPQSGDGLIERRHIAPGQLRLAKQLLGLMEQPVQADTLREHVNNLPQMAIRRSA
jgi:citrate lyase subunit beta / citryl-CoA lyase